MFNENDQGLEKFRLRNDVKDCEERIKRLQKDLKEAENNFKRINELYTELVSDSMAKGKKIRELNNLIRNVFP